MGEVVPRECAPGTLGIYKHSRIEFPLEQDSIQVLEEGVQRKHTAMHMAAASAAMVEPIEEEEEEGEKEGFFTKGLATAIEQVAMLRALPPLVPKL